MKKIPTVFERDVLDRRYVTDQPNPACAWVFHGEGVPTWKYDGTCVRLTRDGLWWARREVRPSKVAPANYVPVELDQATGKTVGWEPIGQSSFAKFHAEAVAQHAADTWLPGTYELVGPKINGNREGCHEHELWAHDTADVLKDGPRTFDGIRERVLAEGESGIEGIVYHHPDGRMAKIKARDFRPVAGSQETTGAATDGAA